MTADPSTIAPRLIGLADEIDALSPELSPVSASVRTDAASVEAWLAAVEPPAPPPPPPPPPPPSGDIGMVHLRQLDPTRLLTFSAFVRQSRYNRFVPAIKLGATAEIEFCADDRDVSSDTFKAPSYTLTCDGMPVATSAGGAGGKGVFNADLSAVEDGWHLFDIVPSEGAETAAPLWMMVCKGDTLPPQPWAPVQTGSWGYYRDTGWVMGWAKVPATITATGWPLPRRDAVPFSHAATKVSMFVRDISPCTDGDPVHLRKTEDGLVTCQNNQAYAWSQATRSRPGVVLRDGPRGVGTAAYITHLQVGRTRNDSNGVPMVPAIYGLDCWRLFKVAGDGAITTLAGWRSTLDTPDGLELVGDWSAVPEARRGFHEPWGFAWVPSTLAVDESAPEIDNGGVMEKPHAVGPTLLVADSQNNRIVAVTFDPASHGTAAVVTELATGLADPWDIVASGNGDTFFVSLRGEHRVVEMDATGAILRTVIQRDPGLPGGASVDSARFVVVTGTLAERRAQPVLSPEGLFVQDGELFIGSIASQQVIAVDIATGARRVVCVMDNLPAKTNYCKIALSDGTFGPRGTVFASVWDELQKGQPYAYLPDGTRWGYVDTGSSLVSGGRGGKYREMGYSMCSAVSGGRLIVGAADYGLREWSLSQQSDPTAVDAALYSVGRAEFERKGYRLIHGIDGLGQFGYPLPWNESAAMDYYLTMNGHVQG